MRGDSGNGKIPFIMKKNNLEYKYEHAYSQQHSKHYELTPHRSEAEGIVRGAGRALSKVQDYIVSVIAASLSHKFPKKNPL
jgi:hypothetical protein